MKGKIDLDEFFKKRAEVLATWPTGAEVSLEEGINFHKALPPEKNFALKLKKVKEEGVTAIQPRAGVALLNEHIALLKYLEKEGEADFLPTTIDSYTRQNRYQEAQRGIEESLAEGRSMLNGFPAVNYGVYPCRKIIEELKVPVQVRHGTPDARLLAEITLAGGFSSFEGGGITYNIPYAKEVPLRKSLEDWQYVDRLIGYYAENGVLINRESFGPLTGTLVPPAITIAINILELLLAAEQGVKSFTLGLGQCGNLNQDVAALHGMVELAEDYLKRFGFPDVDLTTVFHQWMGGFPQDEARAFAVIAWGAVAAALAKANKVIVKTPHEALGVPTKEANAQGLKTTRQIVNMLKDQRFMVNEEYLLEKEMVKKEARAIIERTLELGEGELVTGIERAFAAGVIDVPFAPSRFNLGKILPARDDTGAVRILEFGNLPFDSEIREYHQERLRRRGLKEGREPSFQMVIDDIYAIGKGMLVGKPRTK
ncbi:methylaspartate mutase subunit E [Carboxydothermus pertinax]|uniref:Glutamate mutase epsilon subunit n=1 Tax=Carboxydothermus pertinax TaxID=870242 RepID=A0A1L8CRT3_9THEO|nr:methylaspartate mutase subunit E [Carboxydothermus pertinax]GAV21645.1 methylaspartate mutase subunit E [Carboxydothermus pertinax]